jgi:hypothetical protein
MKKLTVAYALGFLVVSASLAGCGGATPNAAGSANAQAVADHPSRMSPAAKSTDLLYVSMFGDRLVGVYSYSTWNPLGQIDIDANIASMCVDAAQDVYVTDAPSVVEYAHGAVDPIRKLTDHQGKPEACAVDPKTGNLAISNFYGVSGISSPGSVIIYQRAKGTPTKYTISGFAYYGYLGYDPNGDLFVDGNGSSNVLLAELPVGKSTFKVLSTNQTIGTEGAVLWDGKFLAVGDGSINTIYQFKISGSNATVQGFTTLNGATNVNQIWLTGNSAKHPQATAVVGADYSAESVEKWDYPAGGTPLKTVNVGTPPVGVVVSK